jgi:hypothetical protein
MREPPFLSPLSPLSFSPLPPRVRSSSALERGQKFAEFLVVFVLRFGVRMEVQIPLLSSRVPI